MKKVTLKIEDDHYKVIEKLAMLRDENVEDMMLDGIKYACSAILDQCVSDEIGKPLSWDIDDLFDSSPARVQEVGA